MNSKLKIYKQFWIVFILSFVCFFDSAAQFSFSNETVNTSKNGTKVVRLLNEVSTHAEISKYGGNLNVKTAATGYFEIKKINDCWYLVDPDGYLFFTIGVCSVSKGGGVELPDALRNIGANTLGCWSDETINDETAYKMPYCPRWNFMQTYKNSSQRTKDLLSKGIIPVFDPAYISFCDDHAKQLIDTKNNPFLLGHFSDNELPIYDNTSYGNLLDRFLEIQDKSDPNYLAAKNWIIDRKGENYSITEEDRELFHGFVTGTYYRITSEAIKRYDPNHLYLGSRLHGAAKRMPSIFTEAGKYVDMISINVYGTWTPLTEDMDMWSAGDKPFFVTEFYAKAEDSGLGNKTGAGWLVPTQEVRAKFFENFTLALIEHPACVGYHYFRYIDNNDSNKGLLDGDYRWWEPLKNSYYKVARDIYSLREFLTGQTTGVIKNTPSGDINIYNEQGAGKFTISSSSPYLSNIEVFSLNGIRINNYNNVQMPFSFEIQDDSSGLYIVRVKSDHSSYSVKIFKN